MRGSLVFYMWKSILRMLYFFLVFSRIENVLQRLGVRLGLDSNSTKTTLQNKNAQF